MRMEWMLPCLLLLNNYFVVYCEFISTFQETDSKGFERQIIDIQNLHSTLSSLSRTRRNTRDGKTSANLNLPRNISYELEAFKHTFQLNFTLDSSFISPYLIVQKGNFSWIDLAYATSLDSTHALTGNMSEGCYYTGNVNGKALSIGVVNLCSSHGMTGSFLHKDHEYYIEPVGDNNNSHAIYRRNRRSTSYVTKHDTVPDHHCATNTSDKAFTELYATNDSETDHLDHPAPNTDYLRPLVPPRSKRSVGISREHTLELMIVADSKMAEYHGDGLEQYILSLVAVASRIYKDWTLGNFVSLALVKIRIITDIKEGPNITSDAQESLSNFCLWQYNENEIDDAHPYHHDVAVMLTRVNICRSEGKCGTLGLAELGTVCDPKRNCAIIEDNGLSSAFTIAHELGHVFGVPHDDSDTCTKTEISGDVVRRNSYVENQYHLMSSTLDYNSQTWSWSACSRRFITKYLDRDAKVQCLRDKPTAPAEFQDRLDALLKSEPGQSYDKDVQCELVYGSGARICPYMPVCKRLWCTLPDNTGCRTQHMPWADGTECGTGQWCQRGICRAKSLRPPAGDGEWSSWNGWSPCSRTCGGGIKHLERLCDNPSPTSGGNFCLGKRMRYRSCNTEPCHSGYPSYREMQCQSYNGRRFNHAEIPANPKFIPHYSEVTAEQCKLYCSVSGLQQTNYYKMRDRVEDGTKCTKDTTDICVNGFCQPAGCDHVLESKQVVDMCGVCGGDNSTCRLSTFTNRTFTKGVMPYGYNKVLTLPINSSSVAITQTSLRRDDDDNYLAVRDSTNRYLFNGGFVVMMYGLEVKLRNGATIEFSGSEQVEEKITIRDVIAEELTVEVLSVGSLLPANIYYSYVLPVEGKVTFMWDFNSDSWTKCSSECGGQRSQQLSCVREQDNLLVNESNCKNKEKPAVRQQKCNLHCEIRWNIKSIEECSANCGRGFIRRKVTCVKRSISKLEEISASRCTTPKPSSIEACQGLCSPTLWKFSDWSNCSTSCGGGVQTRSAICTLRNGRQIIDFACNKQEKHINRRCNTQDCNQYDIGPWSQCSVTCGLGSQTRAVVCLESGKRVDVTRCGAQPPPSTQPCQVGACPTWQISEWTDCSVTCGTGFRYREVKCIRGVDGDELDDNYCPTQNHPVEVSNCTMVTCPGWVASSWSTCSVSCGGDGLMRRSVECKDHNGSLLPVNLCQMDIKPVEVQPCAEKASCSAHRSFGAFGRQNRKYHLWRYGGWTPCSVTCGEGVKKRYVTCSAESNPELEVNDSFCINQDKPAEESRCRAASCGVWRSGNWGKCSASCGEGVQSRVVICTFPNGNYGSLNDCDKLSTPESEKPCESSPCVVAETTTPISNEIDQTVTRPSKYWRAGAWTKCSESCNGGLRRRAVECYEGYGKSSGCNFEDKPSYEEECNTHKCPTWRQGGWTKCSSDCGYGIQQRMVICQLFNQSAGHADLCDGETPAREKPCFIKPCGNPIWNTTAWSSCSVSCGAGKMTRNVTCVDSHNKSLVLDNGLCSVEGKPSSAEMCIQSSCSSWRYSDWSKCSGPCDDSVRTRDVWCAGLSGNKVAYSRCSKVTEPVSSENCKQKRCNFQWSTSTWSRCSTSCGGGIRSRTMVCKATNGSDVMAINCALWPPPSRSEKCRLRDCPVWKVGAWDQCSVTCGYGQKIRSVDCFNTTSNLTIPEGLCDTNLKPVEITMCQSHPCPTWKTSEWNKCSGRCNASTSVQTRPVLCISAVTMLSVSTSLCDESNKPKISRRCQDCPQWHAEEWSRCSGTCGFGIQARKLKCVGSNGSIKPNDDCRNEARPKLIRSCNRKPCSSWRADTWGQCSVSCGEGRKWRRVECWDDVAQKLLANKHCEDKPRPLTENVCTIQSLCPIWTASLWSECSVSCGTGSKIRNVTCTSSSGIVGDALCDRNTKPIASSQCSSGACDKPFEWKSEEWSECSATCGYGVKSRSLKCYSVKSQQQVPLYFCSTKDKPPAQRRCQQRHCPFTWWADKWSQCSTSCGEGRQFRKVLCKSLSAEGWYTGNSGFGCNIQRKPSAIRSCSNGPCYSSFVWHPGPWGKCSAECGWGNEKRKVWCMTSSGERVPRARCNKLYKPERVQKCYSGPCQANSCSQLRHESSVREDGDYYLLVRNKLVKIYCHRMYSKVPKEYITLPTGSVENYASIYGRRLAHPYVCPNTTSSDVMSLTPSCSNCVSTEYHRAGITRFHKIRVNLPNLTVDGTDFEFSESSGVNKIGYASAGDCYSAVNCPQGRFSVNLANTGFKIAASTKWESEGTYSYKTIYHQKADVIKGKCGGYCGQCAPADGVGLQLEVIDNT